MLPVDTIRINGMKDIKNRRMYFFAWKLSNPTEILAILPSLLQDKLHREIIKVTSRRQTKHYF